MRDDLRATLLRMKSTSACDASRGRSALSRRALLARGLTGTAGLAVGGGVLGHVAPEADAAVSALPASYRIRDMLQDNLANTVTSMNDHFDVAQGANYDIDLCWAPMAGKVRGWLVFREHDPKNFYQLDFFPDRLGFGKKVQGVMTKVAFVPERIDPDHPVMCRLEMRGNTFRTIEQNPASATYGEAILEWTDPDNAFPFGYAVSHYTGPGCTACWEDVSGRPV